MENFQNTLTKLDRILILAADRLFWKVSKLLIHISLISLYTVWVALAFLRNRSATVLHIITSLDGLLGNFNQPLQRSAQKNALTLGGNISLLLCFIVLGKYVNLLFLKVLDFIVTNPEK